jgi:hypothetical protein
MEAHLNRDSIRRLFEVIHHQQETIQQQQEIVEYNRRRRREHKELLDKTIQELDELRQEFREANARREDEEGSTEGSNTQGESEARSEVVFEAPLMRDGFVIQGTSIGRIPAHRRMARRSLPYFREASTRGRGGQQ